VPKDNFLNRTRQYTIEGHDILDRKRLYIGLKKGYFGSKTMIFWIEKIVYTGLKTGYFGSKG
jgi:hypothetical protein